MSTTARPSEKNPVDVTTRESFSAWSVHTNPEIQETRADLWYESLKERSKNDALTSHRGFMNILGRNANAAASTEAMGLGAKAEAAAPINVEAQ